MRGRGEVRLAQLCSRRLLLCFGRIRSRESVRKATSSQPNCGARFVSLSRWPRYHPDRNKGSAPRRTEATPIGSPVFFFWRWFVVAVFFLGFFFPFRPANQPPNTHRHRSGCAGRRSQVSKTCPPMRTAGRRSRGEDARSPLPKKHPMPEGRECHNKTQLFLEFVHLTRFFLPNKNSPLPTASLKLFLSIDRDVVGRVGRVGFWKNFFDRR
jgi:hypothetical protein